MAYYCYILECADGTYYTGWTMNLERRLAQHKSGRGSRYTRSRLPVKLIYIENLPDRSAAMRRENTIKRLPHARKTALAKTASVSKLNYQPSRGKDDRKT